MKLTEDDIGWMLEGEKLTKDGRYVIIPCELPKKLKEQILADQKLRELVEAWATDKGYSHAEVCKELLEGSKNG